MRAYTNSTIREIITRACKERGISLNRLALIVGVTPAYMHDVLSFRKVARPLIRKIANTLGIADLPDIYEHLLHEIKERQKEVENNAEDSTKGGR